MPLTPPTLFVPISSNLIAVGCIGVGTPTLARAVSLGLTFWGAATRVTIQAAGVAGAGVVTMPITVPPPALLATMLQGLASQQILGVASPLLATGLANGISAGLLTGLVVAPVPGVGSGAGLATFRSAGLPSMIQGFKAAGLTGATAEQKARAIGLGLDLFFAAFAMPVVVVGPGGPAAGSAVVPGQIL